MTLQRAICAARDLAEQRRLHRLAVLTDWELEYDVDELMELATSYGTQATTTSRSQAEHLAWLDTNGLTVGGREREDLLASLHRQRDEARAALRR